MYLSPKLPVAKVKAYLMKYKGTNKYDAVLLQSLKGYFKTVLLSKTETIDATERKEWVSAYADIALLSMESQYWLKYKNDFEKLVGISSTTE